MRLEEVELYLSSLARWSTAARDRASLDLPGSKETALKKNLCDV